MQKHLQLPNLSFFCVSYVAGELPAVGNQKIKVGAILDISVISTTQFMRNLTPDQRLSFYDNGSNWLHAIPNGNYRHLSNQQVAVTLNIRTLQTDIFNKPT
jgi:hypothetical protein